MAKTIDSQVLFLTTSPRTPERMIPEIDLLVKNFSGCKWNTETQTEFMELLRDEQFFNGKGENNPALSARDRINRAPKSLGFVDLYPEIKITPAGEALLSSQNREEVLLRQLLKFQIPSPFHMPSAKAADFCIKPYLEMLRLVRVMGTLRFDELQIFGMQLVNWKNFDTIVQKIKSFRETKAQYNGNYKLFKSNWLKTELIEIYKERIKRGELKTRESREVSIEKFIKTQGSNMRDYADACFRYLRATGLVNVSHIGKSLSIVRERIEDVDFILASVDRNPCFITDELRYKSYLGDATLPRLLTDDADAVKAKLNREFSIAYPLDTHTLAELKELYAKLVADRKQSTMRKQIAEIKDYRMYDEIQKTYSQIVNNELYDAPLMLEWNTWRAMTMLDGGNITANLKFDDFGNPVSTAQGNMADIVCDYGDFIVSVEVTMATGQRQYEMEGEPVSRHLGRMKKGSNKPCYAIFIAPTINEACIAHFYTLHHTNISYYGGKSQIIPLQLDVFVKMIEDSYKSDYVPNPKHIQSFFNFTSQLAKKASDETEWYKNVRLAALDWLSLPQTDVVPT